MTANKILINRAPVLTLWASVVAERLGFKHDEALSLGKAVAGLTAQSKGHGWGFSNRPQRNSRRSVNMSEGKNFEWSFWAERYRQ